MENPWHEDAGIRTLIRKRGRIETISEVQDVHIGTLDVNSVFYLSDEGQVEAANMGTVPPTGTELYRASEDVIAKLFEKDKDKIFCLGTRYGSSDSLPFVLRHFDRDLGGQGAGEAYHIGVFGKTGSGKSVLAKMLLFAYARHKNMTVFVIDPQGEFSGDLQRQPVDGEPDMRSRLKSIHGSAVYNPNITELALDEIEMFGEILKETPFFDKLQIRFEMNQEAAWDILQDNLTKEGINVEKFHTKAAFKKVIEIFKVPDNQSYIYRSPGSLAGLKSKVASLSLDENKGWKELYEKYWLKVANLFRSGDRKLSISNLLGRLFPDDEKSPSRSPIIVIDLSEKKIDSNLLLWNSKIKNRVIEHLIRGLQEKGQKFYQKDKNCNTLVIIDEAHRLVPAYISDADSDNEEAKKLRYSLVDAVRTTRKYGIGWMFISQTLGSLDSEIIRQMRTMFFGFGLSSGNEGAALASQIGIDQSSMSLYRSFIDPHAALNFDNRSYPFMSVGPVSPLAASGKPLFFSALNYPKAFFAENKIA